MGVVVAYSRPGERDIEGFDYDKKGYVSIDLLQLAVFLGCERGVIIFFNALEICFCCTCFVVEWPDEPFD